MTCIVGLIDQGVAYFAADSFVGNVPEGYHTHASQTIRREPKIWVKDGIVFGGNGNTRMLQLLRYMHETPPYTHNYTKVEYLVKAFIPSFQECLSKNKCSPEKLDGGILLSLEGELFTIQGHFGVCNTADDYETVGQGGDAPLGSLHTTGQLGLPPRQRLYLALASGQQSNCVVEPPFMYLTNEMTHPQILDEH